MGSQSEDDDIPNVRTDNVTATQEPPEPRLPRAIQTVLFGAFRPWWLPRLRRRYGDVVRVRIYPNQSLVQLANVEHIRAVFRGSPSVFHAGQGNAILKPVMGEHSVLLTDEDVHKRARRLIMPAFNNAALRGYREMITEIAVAEVERWPVNRVFPAHSGMQSLTLEVILHVVFGITTGPRLDELRVLLGRLVDIHPVDLVGWYLPRLQRYGRWRQHTLVQQRVDELLYAEIAERRQEPDLDQRRDVLSRLLTVSTTNSATDSATDTDGAAEPLTDVELRDQLITLLLAGHETTATALAWAVHELGRAPKHQVAAAQAADNGDEKHLEAVMRETMRLHPVVFEVARQLTRDVEIGNYRIPAGYTVMPSMALVQHDPEHHPDPLTFRPDRFLTDRPDPGTWFPFGGGVRRCLGSGFALLESTIVLQVILARYRVHADRRRGESPRARNVTMIPARGARITLTERPTDASD